MKWGMRRLATVLPIRLRAYGILFGFWTVCWCAGCVTENPGRTPRTTPVPPPGPVASREVSELSLMAVPMGMNFDDHPALDGIAIKIFFHTEAHPKAVAIRDGKLDVLMYDGLFVPDQESPPLKRRWRFNGDELQRFLYESALGFGYEMNLPWGDDVPERNNISVVVGFRPGDGDWLISRPSVISVIDPVQPRILFEESR